MRILTAAQMREADRFTIEDIGIPSLVLMENAGRQVVAALEANYEDLLSRRIAVLCGRGSNGGDGFVVARTLAQRGVDVSVFVLGPVAESLPQAAATADKAIVVTTAMRRTKAGVAKRRRVGCIGSSK